MSRKIHFERSKHPSSEGKRQAARDRSHQIKAREDELKRRGYELRNWGEALAKAARFVIDVDGDPTALAALQQATERAEEAIEVSAERRELIDERQALRPQTWYHQHRAVRFDGMFNVIIAEADTLAELKAKVKEKATP